MPPIQPPSKMPKGLTPEEKKEYQKERNRRKQAALRARRAAKVKELAAATTSTSTSSLSPPLAGTSNNEGSTSQRSPSDSGRSAGSWNSLDESTRFGIVDALARSDAEVARLTSTVGRLVGKLVELGIDDGTIGMLLREVSVGTPPSKESPLSCSSLSSVSESPMEIPDAHPSCFASKDQDMLFLLASTSSSSSSPFDLASPPLPPPPPPPSDEPSFQTHPFWTNVSYASTSAVENPPSSSFITVNPPSHLQPYPSDDSFGLFSAPSFPPGLGLDAEMLREALNLTHQPVPSPVFNFNPFAQFDDLGGSFWNSTQPSQQQSSPRNNLPLRSSENSYLNTLLELHLAYRTSRRRSLSNPSYHSNVSASAVKELQLVILRLLFASSDQREVYPSPDEPLSEEDQAYLVSGAVDERLMMLPSRPIVKVVSGRTAHLFDCAALVAEIIESTRIFGDVHDMSGWTMPITFWSDYHLEVPEELARVCTPTDLSTIPAGLRGATIREIVMKLEKPGWRTSGPFPLPPPLESVWDQPNAWEQEWNVGGMEGRRSVV